MKKKKMQRALAAARAGGAELAAPECDLGPGDAKEIADVVKGAKALIVVDLRGASRGLPRRGVRPGCVCGPAWGAQQTTSGMRGASQSRAPSN